MLQIRPAAPTDYARLEAFYRNIIDTLADAPYRPNWVWGIYPDRELLLSAIADGTLHLAEEDGQVAACMLLNSRCEPEYAQAPWTVDAAPEQVRIIHALGVRPDRFGQGIAGQMIQYAAATARAAGCRALRLDVLKGNLPAERTYPKQGFEYRHTVSIFYENTGWADFMLYELPL